jgi:hypothetical protein
VKQLTVKPPSAQRFPFERSLIQPTPQWQARRRHGEHRRGAAGRTALHIERAAKVMVTEVLPAASIRSPARSAFAVAETFREGLRYNCEEFVVIPPKQRHAGASSSLPAYRD